MARLKPATLLGFAAAELEGIEAVSEYVETHDFGTIWDKLEDPDARSFRRSAARAAREALRHPEARDLMTEEQYERHLDEREERMKPENHGVTERKQRVYREPT